MINATLQHRVSSALEGNVYLRGRQFYLETEQGHVTLRGEVGTYHQKQMAQEAVRRVVGVDAICNEIEVATV